MTPLEFETEDPAADNELGWRLSLETLARLLGVP